MTDPDLMTRIQSEMTAAMKSQDATTLSTLRMLKTALMEASRSGNATHHNGPRNEAA